MKNLKLLFILFSFIGLTAKAQQMVPADASDTNIISKTTYVTNNYCYNDYGYADHLNLFYGDYWFYQPIFGYSYPFWSCGIYNPWYFGHSWHWNYGYWNGCGNYMFPRTFIGNRPIVRQYPSYARIHPGYRNYNVNRPIYNRTYTRPYTYQTQHPYTNFGYHGSINNGGNRYNGNHGGHVSFGGRGRR